MELFFTEIILKILPPQMVNLDTYFLTAKNREDASKRMKDLLSSLTIHGNIFNTAKFLKLIIQTNVH